MNSLSELSWEGVLAYSTSWKGREAGECKVKTKTGGEKRLTDVTTSIKK